MEEVKEKVEASKKKGKTKIIITIIVLLLAIAAFLFWWFTRKFEVTFKYNNGDADSVVIVKYLNKIKKEDVKENLVREGYYFAGYYETYYLNGKEIEKIKSDSKNEETICKEGFKLDSEKIKCVYELPFDFVGTKIKKDTTIEALWSAQPLPEPTPEPTPAPAPQDTGTVSLTANDQCLIGTDTVTITANIGGNALDKTINWSSPNCFTLNKTSNTTATMTRSSCGSTEGLNPTVTARLNNGNSNSLTFTYEDSLVVEVYDGNTKINPDSEGAYNGGHVTIKTNASANFSGNNIASKTDTSATLYSSSDSTVTITTQCGQSKTIVVKAVIF